MKDVKGDPIFVILKYSAWVDAEKFESKLLGAIVKEFLSPTNNYKPAATSPLQYHKPDLVEGYFTDFVIDNSAIGEKAAEAKLESISGYNFKGKISDATRLNGKFIRYKRLQQIDDLWKLLLEDKEVKSTVPKWARWNAWNPCLVLGIMTCEDVEISLVGEESREINGEVKVPLATIAVTAGVPNPLPGIDPKLSATYTTENRHLFEAKSRERRIFAIEVRKIKLKPVTGKLVLLNHGPSAPDTRTMGDDSDDSEDSNGGVKVEGLVLEPLTGEEYEEITD